MAKEHKEHAVFFGPGYSLNIGERVTVGLLHGCTIGNGALIGMRVIVLNGAVIGDEAVKTVIPPGGREREDDKKPDLVEHVFISSKSLKN